MNWLTRAFVAFFFLLLATPALPQVPKGIGPCAPNSLSVSSVSSNVQLSTCGSSLVLMNLTSQEAFFKIGQLSSTAATTTVTDSYSLPGGAYILIVVPGLTGAPGWYLAGITATSTTTLRIIQGNAQ